MRAVFCLRYEQHVPSTSKLRAPTMLTKQELPTQVAARYLGSLLPRFEPKFVACHL